MMQEPQERPLIDVTQVTGRRELHFSSLDDVLQEAGRLLQRKAEVRPLGNLTLGQALAHVARTMQASVDGFGFTVPPEVQAVGRAHKDAVLAGPMRPGTRLPAEGEARFIPPPCTAEEGLAQLAAAARRLASETPCGIHPYLGELTADEWIRLLCRHAELHLGFMALK
jgi:hypothetical protein